jgi:hypothetical protein
VPIQEGSSSLATDKIMSNPVISTVALIGLIIIQHHTFKILAGSHHESSQQSTGLIVVI